MFFLLSFCKIFLTDILLLTVHAIAVLSPISNQENSVFCCVFFFQSLANSEKHCNINYLESTLGSVVQANFWLLTIEGASFLFKSSSHS